ncbi:hypothetical protein RS022_08370 [Candidatus Phytoplasma rubi]|uniref:Uncharacterized protein n=1 Tax=Candidatus Phytoplasma rubi TaxID=399025 RepID=A0ABY7BV06_9MOLU|nr:hypothetical protein [Candidatus Phytoplasma rubi]WAN63635.1 hypothetical protein RS022_08370 [Candidatus Phytoplasma rubi]
MINKKNYKKINLNILILFFMFIILLSNHLIFFLINASNGKEIESLETFIPISKRILFIQKKDKNNKEKILEEIRKINPLLKDLPIEYVNLKPNNEIQIIIPENSSTIKKIYGQVILNIEEIQNIEVIIPENKRTIKLTTTDKNNKEKILEEIQKINPLLKDLNIDDLTITNNQISIIISDQRKEILKMTGVINIKILEKEISETSSVNNPSENNPQVSNNKITNNKSNVFLWIIITLVILILLGGLYLFFYIKHKNKFIEK